MRLVTCATTLVILLTAAHARATGEPQQGIPFSLDASGAIVVPVHLDGQGPFRFMLDTGASASLVADTVAHRLGAPIVARAEVITATGREMHEVAALRLTLGDVSAERLLPSVMPAHILTAVSPRIDGILGQDFLMKHNYTLDYRRKTFWWGVTNTIRGTAVPLVERDGRWLLEATQTDGRLLTFVPDTGSEHVVLFARDGRLPVQGRRATTAARLDTLAGGQDVNAVVIDLLTVGPLVVRNEWAAVVARDGHGAPEGDGLLPLHRFRMVAFDAHARSLRLSR